MTLLGQNVPWLYNLNHSCIKLTIMDTINNSVELSWLCSSFECLGSLSSAWSSTRGKLSWYYMKITGGIEDNKVQNGTQKNGAL